MITMNDINTCLIRRFAVGEIVSKSPAMEKIFKLLPLVAKSPCNVLILGETGTGKEMIAKAIHCLSDRKNGPFVAVNCGAIPETLLESELFGSKAGAYTDAKQDRQGRFASAAQGSLLLDEIGDISLALQVKLLRVIQQKEYEALGSDSSEKADVRIMAASNRDLETMAKEGGFRKDLFYRLNVISITLPPLRHRREDIPMLISHFIKKHNTLQRKDVEGVSDPALDLLLRHHYPGNIRELENIIEYAFIFCKSGRIRTGHMPEDLFGARDTGGKPLALSPHKPHTLGAVERQVVLQALERNNWRKMATCRELGIAKDTLRRKIKQYQLDNSP